MGRSGGRRLERAQHDAVGADLLHAQAHGRARGEVVGQLGRQRRARQHEHAELAGALEHPPGQRHARAQHQVGQVGPQQRDVDLQHVHASRMMPHSR